MRKYFGTISSILENIEVNNNEPVHYKKNLPVVRMSSLFFVYSMQLLLITLLISEKQTTCTYVEGRKEGRKVEVYKAAME